MVIPAVVRAQCLGALVAILGAMMAIFGAMMAIFDAMWSYLWPCLCVLFFGHDAPNWHIYLYILAESSTYLIPVRLYIIGMPCACV